MKKIIFIILLWTSFQLHASTEIPFDFNWKFSRGDYPESIRQNFDDTNWRILNLPHDWSIEENYDSTANEGSWQNGYLAGGIAWYRKSFSWQEEWKGKEIHILFDGIYMNSTVWINGLLLGNRPYGYIGFSYDLTPYLQEGENILTVKVDHSKALSSRWYTGSGIYRHVRLLVSDQVHIPVWGIYFTTPECSEKKAEACIRTTVINKSTVSEKILLRTQLKTRDGIRIASTEKETTLAAGSEQEITQQITVARPHRWSPEKPTLYVLESTVETNGKTRDSRKQFVGFRKIEYSPSGFFLNNEPIRIKGVCDHHTGGALGAAVPDQALERKIKILKAMGCNAIRTAHNPFSPEFYTICDTMGLIVMDEAFDGWDKTKTRDDYGNYFDAWWERDLTDMILRDRNHPCIFFWSIGNEVRKGTPERQKQLVDLIHRLDPTRPVSQGGTDPTRGMKTNYDANFRFLDIVGFNGNGEEVGELEMFHQNMPERCGIGTEIPHTYQTRGVYRTKTAWRRRDFPAPWEKPESWKEYKNKVFDNPDLSETEVFPEEAAHPYYQSSYDNAAVRINARKSWQRSSSFPWFFGEFRWGSFDYLGESEWPQRTRNQGIIDLCGFPKDHYYLYQSLWSAQSMVHILPHWTHPGKEGISIPVVIYTNCESVELFLNGKSMGKQTYKGEQLMWQVPYQEGEIKAIARNGNKIVVQKIQKTAGKANSIQIQADRYTAHANQTDVIHFELDITDCLGTMCPYADNEIRFNITGPARLIGVDNGDPVDLSPYRAPSRKAFRGKVLLILQTTDKPGKVVVEASSPGLKNTMTTINILP